MRRWSSVYGADRCCGLFLCGIDRPYVDRLGRLGGLGGGHRGRANDPRDRYLDVVCYGSLGGDSHDFRRFTALRGGPGDGRGGALQYRSLSSSRQRSSLGDTKRHRHRGTDHYRRHGVSHRSAATIVIIIAAAFVAL